MGVVEVYFNLHRRCFSVRQGGRVIAHPATVILHDCKFVVQKGGQRRVRETGRKNVHAFVRGIPTDQQDMPYVATAQRVRYNPYIHDSFVVVDDQMEVAVKASNFVLLDTVNLSPVIWAWGVSG